MMYQENFFVAIKETESFRRYLLESSKEILLILKSNQRIQALRNKKLELIESLKDQIKELLLLLDKLEAKMPAHELFKDLKLEGFDLDETKKTKKAPKKAVEKKLNQEMQDLDKLEKALDAIENKLDKLN